MTSSFWRYLAEASVIASPGPGVNPGDAAHAYLVAPHEEGFVDAEVLFKGRQACDIALVENLRELFVASLAPAP